jgi:hypothetical protein
MTLFGKVSDDTLKAVAEAGLTESAAIKTMVNREHSTAGGVARMLPTSKLSDDTFRIATGDDAQVFLEAALGTLLDRQAMFGPLLRYPRTLVVGPRGGFVCSPSMLRGDLSWSLIPTAETNAFYARDFDQILWVNHCSSSLRPRVYGVQVNVARLDQHGRQDMYIPCKLYRSTFYDSGTSGFPDAQTDLATQFAKLWTSLGFNAKVGFGSTKAYEAGIRPEDPVVDITNSVSSGKYLRAAAAVLERVMRDMRSSVKEVLTYSEQGRATGQEDLLFNAIVAGVVPYAELDIRDAGVDGSDPAVPYPPPGETTIPRLLDIWQISGAELGSPVSVWKRQPPPPLLPFSTTPPPYRPSYATVPAGRQPSTAPPTYLPARDVKHRIGCTLDEPPADDDDLTEDDMSSVTDDE